MASSSPKNYRGVIPPLRASRSSTSVDPTRERFDALLPKYGFMWRSMANAKLSGKPTSQPQGTTAPVNKENSSPNRRNAATVNKSEIKSDKASAEVPSLLGAILNKQTVSLSIPSQDHELCGDDCNCAEPILEIEEDDDDDEKDGVVEPSSVHLDEVQTDQDSDDDSVQLVSARKQRKKQTFILESDDDDFEMNESSLGSEPKDVDEAPKGRKSAAFDDLSDFNPSSEDDSDDSSISSGRSVPVFTRRNPTRRTAAALTFSPQSDFISDSEDDDAKSSSSEEEWDEEISLEEKDEKQTRTRRVNTVIILSDDEEYDSESDLEEDEQSAFTISDDEDESISDKSVAQSFVENKTRNISPPIRNATKSPRIPKKKKAVAKTPEAAKTRAVNFNKHRDNLTSETFAEFNRLAFSNQLSSVNVTWSKKLNTTAGITRMRGKLGEKHSNSRVATIELATKVIENEEQLRSTLLHEMCHAAAWLVDGVVKPPHGKVFKQWASKSMKKINDVVVTTTHDYQINYKFAWACTNEKCNVVIKRHSRSVDLNKHCCGRCKSKLIEIEVPKKGEDISNNAFTPKKQRKTSEYALFVKKHSGSIREKLARQRLCSPKEVSQADVMKECGAEWQRRKHGSSANPISEMINLTLG